MLVSWDADQQLTAALVTCYKVNVLCPIPDLIRCIKTHCNWDHKCCIGSIHEQHKQRPAQIQLAGWAQDWKSVPPEETPGITHCCLHTVGAMLSCSKDWACLLNMWLFVKVFCPVCVELLCRVSHSLLSTSTVQFTSLGSEMLSARSFQIVTRGVSVATEPKKRSTFLDYDTFREAFCTRLSQNSIVWTLNVLVRGRMLQHARQFSDHSDPVSGGTGSELAETGKHFLTPTHWAQRTPEVQQKAQSANGPPSNVAAQIASPWGHVKCLV